MAGVDFRATETASLGLGLSGPAVLLMLAVIATLGLTGCAQTGGFDRHEATPEDPSRIFPWQWWRDLSTLSVVPGGEHTVLGSSFCPTGCRFDRHSADESRFIRIREDGEGVIFSTRGAGALTRIWIVMGDGISQTLDKKIRLRVRIDGRRRPVVDLPLSVFFSGEKPPFLSPMVVDLTTSGGGNVSYVPITFRDGCEVSLRGADQAKIWYQIVARLVDDPTGLRSFSSHEDLSEFASVLERHGRDPWAGGTYPTVGGSAVLVPGGAKTIATFQGPDVINGLIIRTSRKHWKRLGLRFTFDDREPMLIPLPDLFGIIRVNQPGARTLLFGVDRDDDLYCYFPMPFFEKATVELMRRPVEGPSRLRVEYAVRRLDAEPPDNAGYFGVQVRAGKRVPADTEVPMLNLDGNGVWVGFFSSFESDLKNSWDFLEADERVFVNGEDDPSWHGTGVEDFFGGGFYFRHSEGRPRAFSQPLHGVSSVDFLQKPAPVMYRLLLGDGVVFDDGIAAGFESLVEEGSSINTRSVAFYYLR